jgi:hypothetical protein
MKRWETMGTTPHPFWGYDFPLASRTSLIFMTISFNEESIGIYVVRS